uniref:Uncharacterized protein LOC111133506 isoform X1 n=1 Tax=Crassostrea virginica TaxID=6565 RepID=A0A8B8EAJ6_CRAVI|nr:uncharacterized protein LOC111133506 isoform X1 [Crassostrea virginica]
MDESVIVLLLVCCTLCNSSTTVGPNMCGNGVCCSGFQLEGDRCIECTPGSFGLNCSLTCGVGYHGLKCQEQCPSQCDKTCDKVSGVCPDKAGNTTKSLKEDINSFLRDNIFPIVGVSSIFVVSSSCFGSICIYKSCKSKKKKRRAIVQMANQNSQPSNQSFSVRYESNDVLNQTSTSPQLPQRHNYNNTTENGRQEIAPKVEYSKPQKRYSLVRSITSSQNVTSCHWSDGSDDEFDSEEYDDCVNNPGSVQVSGLPKQQSFKSFQSEGHPAVDANGAYGNIWL